MINTKPGVACVPLEKTFLLDTDLCKYLRPALVEIFFRHMYHLQIHSVVQRRVRETCDIQDLTRACI